jgi:hypothetical protein
MINEADTCRKYVLPKLYGAGWSDDQISEQKSFTDGRILVVGNKARRRPSKRVDYLLRYARDFMLAVVEAKAAYKLPGDGLQQAKDYALLLGVKSLIRPMATVSLSSITQRDGIESSTRFPNRWSCGSDSAPPKTSPKTGPRAEFSRRPTLLPGDRHQPCRASAPAGQEASAAYYGNRHRQNSGRLSNLLEALEHALESDRRISPAKNPLSRRPEHPHR